MFLDPHVKRCSVGSKVWGCWSPSGEEGSVHSLRGAVIVWGGQELRAAVLKFPLGFTFTKISTLPHLLLLLKAQLLFRLVVTSFVSSQRAEDKLVDHAEDEVGPEHMEALQHQQHCIEEVVPKEGRVVQRRVHPGTVDQPKRENDESRPYEHSGKQNKETLAGSLPFGVVK